MFYSIVELITQAASSSAFIFGFCNLIIVIILMDLKPTLSFNQESEIPVSMVKSTAVTQKPGENSKCQVDKNTPSTEEAGEVSQGKEEEAVTVDKIETQKNDNCSNEEEDEEEDDDELRRKVEEFIEKVNKAWKVEMLSTRTSSSLV